MKTPETKSENKTVSRAVANNIKKAKPPNLNAPGIQAKLTIGKPNDKYEQEADRVADQVMRMPEPIVQRQIEEEEEEPVQMKSFIQRQVEEEEEPIQTKPLASEITPWVQRQVEEEEEELQMKPLIQRQPEEEEEELQMQPIEEEEKEPAQTKLIQKQSNKPQTASSWVESNINSTKGDGSPLPKDTRSFMGNRFGANFSNVKIHNDSNSAQLNKQLNSQAFTKGKDIYFNQGKYNLGTSSGKYLLAHELTHVVQQTGLSTYSNRSNSLSENVQRAVDPISAVGLGLAVFVIVRSLIPYGSKGLKWKRNIAKAVHKWLPGKKPAVKHWRKNWFASILDINCISGLSSAWGMWGLRWNWNGADISQAHVFKQASSSWSGGSTGSELSLTFELSDASASYEKGGKAAMMCYIDGFLDPVGSGDIDFAGRLLIFSDGSTKRVGNLRITRGNKSDFTISSMNEGWSIEKK